MEPRRMHAGHACRPIPGFDNVVYDAASAYPWEALNETDFLARFFAALAGRMGSVFAQWRFFVLSAHDPLVAPASASEPGPRKVLLFISDESCTMPDRQTAGYDVVFKSYLPDAPRHPSIRSFPLGCVRDVPELPVRPPADRPIGLFFSGNLNTNRFPLYRQLHPALRHLPAPLARLGVRVARRLGWPTLRTDFSDPVRQRDVRFTTAFKGGLSPADYGRRLADSRIVLCPRGFTSPETFRHMEALRAGAVVISEPLPATRWYAGSPIQQVPDWREGLRLADDLLRSPDRLAALHLRSVAWWNDVCSPAAVAAHVAEELAAR